jgi:hypothetical protein
MRRAYDDKREHAALATIRPDPNSAIAQEKRSAARRLRERRAPD